MENLLIFFVGANIGATIASLLIIFNLKSRVLDLENRESEISELKLKVWNMEDQIKTLKGSMCSYPDTRDLNNAIYDLEKFVISYAKPKKKMKKLEKMRQKINKLKEEINDRINVS